MGESNTAFNLFGSHGPFENFGNAMRPIPEESTQHIHTGMETDFLYIEYEKNFTYNYVSRDFFFSCKK